MFGVDLARSAAVTPNCETSMWKSLVMELHECRKCRGDETMNRGL